MEKEQKLRDKKGITYRRCCELLFELETIGEHLTVNAPSISDKEGTILVEKRVNAMNTIWDYVNELKNNCA